MTAESQLLVSPTVMHRSLRHLVLTVPGQPPPLSQPVSSCWSFPNLTLAVATSILVFTTSTRCSGHQPANFLLFLPTQIPPSYAPTWKACSSLLPVSSLASTPTQPRVLTSSHGSPVISSCARDSPVWAARSIPQPQRIPWVFSLLPTVPETRGTYCGLSLKSLPLPSLCPQPSANDLASYARAAARGNPACAFLAATAGLSCSGS